VDSTTTLANPGISAGPLLAGRYAYRGELGRGATGRVLHVVDTRAKGTPDRALKVVEGGETVARLAGEFRRLSMVSHPGVARAHELLRLDAAVPAPFRIPAGAAVLVQSLAPGRPAQDTVRGRTGAARVAWILAVAEQVARGLRALHRVGLVHGDVKPDNVVVQDSGPDDDPEPAGPRAVLVDLGAAGPPGFRSADGAVTGTPAFLAPEAWRGERRVATDLYALGATIHELLGGRHPGAAETASDPGERLRHLLARPRRAADLPDEVPDELRRLVDELLAPDASLRPRDVVHRLAALSPSERSADAIAEELGDEGGPERAAAILELPLVGRDRAMTALVDALATPGLVLVVGPRGAGRSRLVREAVGRLQGTRALAGEPAPTYLPIDGAGSDTATASRAPDGAILHLDDPPRARALAREADLPGGPGWRVVLEAATPPAELGLDVDPDRVISLGPLAPDDLAEILAAALGARPSPAWRDAALEVSGGLPGVLCRALAADARSGDAALEEPRRLLETAPARTEFEDADAASPGLVPLRAVLAAAGGAVPLTALLDRLPDLPGIPETAIHELQEAGLATLGPQGELRLRRDELDRIAPAVPDALVSGVDRLAAALLESGTGQEAREAGAFLRLALGDTDEAVQRLEEAAVRRQAEGNPEAAARLLARAVERLPPRVPAARLHLARAESLRAVGRYRDARDALGSLVGKCSLGVELLRLEGRLADAEEEGARVLARATPPEPLRVRAVLARVAFDAGDLDLADERAASLGHGDEAATPRGVLPRAFEVRGLVAWSRGRLNDARSFAVRAHQRAQAEDDPPAMARARSLEALVALSATGATAARRLWQEALALAERSGERHAAAAFLLNSGSARLHEGDVGPAMALLRTAARRFSRLETRELAVALFSLGDAAALVGDDDLAAAAARRAAAEGAAQGFGPPQVFAAVLRAELAGRAGDPAAAFAAADQGVAVSSGLDTHVRVTALARRAALQPSAEAAEADLAAARSLADAQEGAGVLAEVAIAAAQVAQRFGPGDDAEELGRQALHEAGRAGIAEARLRAALVAAETSRAPEARRIALAEARSILDRFSRGLSPADRARLRRVAAYQAAFATAPDVSKARSEERGRATAPSRWRRFASVARRLAGERRAGRIRESLVDVAIDLLGAERGLYLERRDGPDGGADWSIRVARDLDGRDLAEGDRGFSRSVAARALDEGAPSHTVDAAADAGLEGLDSVHALALRSVVVAPIRGSDARPAAVLYLEDRLRPAAFGPEDLELLGDLTDLGAIGLDAAEAYRTERRQRRRLAAMRHALERRVAAQALELDAARRAAGAPIEGFEGIVAVSPAMRQALRLAARVADSDLPVLITGESGTGKELVARAVHGRSPRASKPFVGESCAAIPDPLLESALFGHVKGAFTGADRERVGLLEAANGGTLFLDEIGEMSAAMQSRLLRAVQEGEVRPVGSERVRHVDVRFVAATHRDLSRMVEEGTFREDLFYRLAVVVIRVPPLRERPEDIEPLLAHLIGRHAGDRRVRVDPRVLDRMRAYEWPGNVRQLENEVQRALVLADGDILPEHLSPPLLGQPSAGTGAPPGTAPPRRVDPHDMKGQVAALERQLIEEALARCDNNQTQAAKMLGVSRYGLQKMIKRLL